MLVSYRGGVQMRAALAYAHGAAGRKDAAEAILRKFHDESRREYVSPYWIAVVYAGLGRDDVAFEWLERAYRERTDRIAYITTDPFFAPLRSHPRFQALLPQ